MILQVFSVYDSAVEGYTNPFYFHHKGEAIRGFTEIANDPTTKVNKYPDQYTLFWLGEYDASKGVFHNKTTPESLGLALHYIRNK